MKTDWPRFDEETSKINKITGIWQFTAPGDNRYRGYSLPGHHFHYTLCGSYSITLDGRIYHPGPGDLTYMYNCCRIQWDGDGSEVRFYALGFFGGGPLFPADIPAVHHLKRDLTALFQEMYEEYHLPPGRRRTWSLFRGLYSVLESLGPAGVRHGTGQGSEDEFWWDLENRIREDALWHIRIADLLRNSGVSRRTIERSCLRATGLTPGRRLAQIRMEEAVAALLFTADSITVIAGRLAYTRMHEFSREFKRVYGMPPSRYRERFRPGV